MLLMLLKMMMMMAMTITMMVMVVMMTMLMVMTMMLTMVMMAIGSFIVRPYSATGHDSNGIDRLKHHLFNTKL